MYYVMLIFSWLICQMSERMLMGLARVLTFVGFDLFRLRRQVVLANLAIAFPALTVKERLKIGRDSIYNFILTIFELLYSLKHDIAKEIEIEGEEHIRRALAEGRGVYVLCFHLGNWEAMGAKMTKAIAPSHVLVKAIGRGGVNRFVNKLRAKNQFLMVKRQKKGDGFRAIQDILARGEIVGFVMDQSRPGEPRLPFFGVPAKTNTSLAAIWRRFPAPIVPAYIHRHSFGHHTLEFHPALDLPVGDQPEQDIRHHSEIFNKVIEAAIRRFPGHYFWLHNRWK